MRGGGGRRRKREASGLAGRVVLGARGCVRKCHEVRRELGRGGGAVRDEQRWCLRAVRARQRCREESERGTMSWRI